MAIFRLPLKILVLLMGKTDLVDRPAWEHAWEVVEAEEERAPEPRTGAPRSSLPIQQRPLVADTQ